MISTVMRWTNPLAVDLHRPYLYVIVVVSPRHEYRYVGKGSSPSRMDAYARNVQRVLAGKTKRPAVTRDGREQSAGNRMYRYVHLVLAAAVKNGWTIEHYPLENCNKSNQSALVAQRTIELECDVNNGRTWFIEEFESLLQRLTESHP